MVAFLRFALIDFSFHLNLRFDGVKRGIVTSDVAVVMSSAAGGGADKVCGDDKAKKVSIHFLPNALCSLYVALCGIGCIHFLPLHFVPCM